MIQFWHYVKSWVPLSSHHSKQSKTTPTALTKPIVIKSLKGTHEENQLNSHNNIVKL